MGKQYDLEERTFQFAKSIRMFLKSIPNTVSNAEDGKQLIRSSGSIGANYIEANEASSKKDFLYRMRIALKESKESHYWLRLINETNKISNTDKLLNEAVEVKKILASIIEKSK